MESCSFCGKDNDNVKILFGSEISNAFICNECLTRGINKLLEIINEDKEC